MTTHYFEVNSLNLKPSLNAVKVLFPYYKITIRTTGNFCDLEGETVFGSCEVTEVRRNQFTFEADGKLWDAHIAAVKEGFMIIVED